MLVDERIVIGKAGEEEAAMQLNMMNRHGFIAGATGTGKTVTLKVIAESLCEAGVPTFICDIKGDLTGMIESGDADGIQERLQSMGIINYPVRSFPVRFYDVYRRNGLPIRSVLQEMSPLLISRILGLSEAQQGVLTIIFKVAHDMDLDLIDLKDLQAMTAYVSENAKELSNTYGNIARQSVGTIQRRLLELEEQNGGLLFGMPALDIRDLMEVKQGEGTMSILECSELFQHPMIYSAFLLWLLDAIYNELPEVGDLKQPKIVFFFDEAHLLFDDASKPFMEQIERTIKLIRSKGVGIFFCTQSPSDIPASVQAQLSNRIQHALRAYTPAEIKAVKTAADSFRANPAFNTADVITSMKTGYALVSCLDDEGVPSVVQETKIFPPKSSMKAADSASIQSVIQHDRLKSEYFDDIDPESAYEMIDDLKEKQEKEKLEAKEKEEAAKKAEKNRERLKRKVTNRAENEIMNLGIRSAKKVLKGLLK